MILRVPGWPEPKSTKLMDVQGSWQGGGVHRHLQVHQSRVIRCRANYSGTCGIAICSIYPLILPVPLAEDEAFQTFWQSGTVALVPRQVGLPGHSASASSLRKATEPPSNA